MVWSRHCEARSLDLRFIYFVVVSYYAMQIKPMYSYCVHRTEQLASRINTIP